MASCLPPATTCDCDGRPVSVVEACPIPEYERCVVAGGEGHLRLLGAHRNEHAASGVTLRPLSDRNGRMIELPHDGPLEAVAWGHEPIGGLLYLAACGLSSLSASVPTPTLDVHKLSPGSEAGAATKRSIPLPKGAGSVRSCAFLQGNSDKRLCLAGDGNAALVVDVDGGGGKVVASYALGAPGCALALSTCVAVRTHPAEPSQLMLALDDGRVHFFDVRAGGSGGGSGGTSPTSAVARPSLSRSVPLDATDAAGLIDVDWSPRDPYLVGGVCGSRWLAWDIRQAADFLPPGGREEERGLPHSGDAQPTPCTSFRWSPAMPKSFATCGSSNTVYVHSVTPRDEWGGKWQMHEPTKLGHDLPTRVGALSWVRSHPSMPPMLVGCADSKVCLWALSTPDNGDSMGMLQ